MQLFYSERKIQDTVFLFKFYKVHFLIYVLMIWFVNFDAETPNSSTLRNVSDNRNAYSGFVII